MNITPALAYIVGAISVVLCIIFAVISAQSIAFESGINPKDPAKRKLWFWIFCIVCVLATFFVCFYFYGQIKVPRKASAFLTHTCISTISSLVLYVVCGVVLSKTFRHGKLSSWF